MEWAEFHDSKNKRDVLRQLQDLGYDLTERTFYRHCAVGKCRTGKGGLYTRRTVKQYIESEGIAQNGVDPADDDGPNTQLSIEKQRLENEKLKWHNKTAQLEYQKKAGKLIEREALAMELAARVVVLDTGFNQTIEMEAAAIIALVGGDQTRMPEFIETIRNIWNALLNSYATTDEFEVLFAEEEIEHID